MTSKREHEDVDEEDDECIGPMPDTSSLNKKQKVLEFEKLYLENLPNSESYEKSYMHKDVVKFVAVTKTDFILTASADGHLKFWRKTEEAGIEFVKHFRCHLGSIEDMKVSNNGELACTVSDDKSSKVFDVVNFDMINMYKLEFVPGCCGWIYNSGDAIPAVAIAEKETPKVHIYDGRGSSTPLHVIEKLHYKPVTLIKYNPVCDLVLSCDKGGMLEVWTGPKGDYKFPKNLQWEYKTDTDLYDFVKCKCVPTDLCFSPDGKKFASISTDRKVRIFKVLTGKMVKVLDESLQNIIDLQQMKQQLSNMEFGRRLALEKELEKADAFNLCNILFDETGYFLLYGTMLGVKVINLHTNRCMKILGKPENPRFLQIALFQGSGKKAKAATDVPTAASDNPLLQTQVLDPILFCTAYKKNRFYMFTRREPFDKSSADADRDVFNEKPSKEELISATQDISYTRVADTCVIYTTLGDITCKLFSKECPKTVENFCVHSRDGYYNGHIVHRVIKGFMIQTGDPLGNGTGGESIWGGEFEDEFHPNLRHDRPYTLSMANAGPNTNGSQFFITVVPTPWLDNKHTVFGRVTRGMEVVQSIANVKTNPKTDKPHDDICIVNIAVK
ncbi:peptidylprolyl isomerase domain and WD repeat-containing protein 1-like isoform X1 [Mercenaria mercenaria]|uniref:peptidylprolyl isomerase domain and WD repeat-containing protein 1-like isoform X1 n=1 Tax=Mercenaria mercenaria TaxID=6596 RepID=UPI00234E85EF|nr:peptidylprolyl isomerase domain and WD repeat-containing protein 1-like isoform X1 [Mercenaria mercenaria]